MALYLSTEEMREPVSFKDLGLPIGSVMTLETQSPVRKLSVHLVGYEHGKSVIVSAPKRSGKEVVLNKDEVVAVRLLEGKQVCAFESKVIYRSMHPFTYYHLAYPAEVEAQQVRSSERVDTSINVDVDSDFNIVGDWPKYAQITNLSRTGARLRSSETLGEQGHELLLLFELPVSGIIKQVHLACIVRNIDSEEGQFGQIHYILGVQFLEMNDEARLTLANYIYEHDKH